MSVLFWWVTADFTAFELAFTIDPTIIPCNPIGEIRVDLF